MVIKINYRIISFILAGVVGICAAASLIFAPADSEELAEADIPIVMYHHISEDKSALNNYVISPEELENDIKFLKEKGYEFILPKQLLQYVKGEATLPRKPIIISFDDGFESVLCYASPLYEKYGLKFTLAVIGSQTDLYSAADDHNILYSYVTWNEIKELSDSGIAEIANHTYDLHSSNERKGINIKPGEKLSDYEKTVSKDILTLQKKLEENAGISPVTFVYPFGFTCDESVSLIKNLGFQISFSCYEGINHINHNPECLYCLKRYNRPHGISTYDFFKKIKGIV